MQEVVFRGYTATTLNLGPGDYAIAAQCEYTLQARDTHGVDRDIEVGERLSPYSRAFTLAEQTTVVIKPRGEVTILKDIVEPLHTWARTWPPHVAGETDPAPGPEFELVPGRYRFVSDLTVAVDRLVSPPETPVAEREWQSVTLTAEQSFTVPSTATHRVTYPLGGKGHTHLYED